jgi:hypothetical protein
MTGVSDQQSDALDARYGACIEPNGVTAHEQAMVPRSLQKLADCALQLNELMKAAQNGLGLVAYVYSERPILWVVDRGGTLWVALEETLDLETGEFTYPRIPRTGGDTKRYTRLGHPAMVKCEAARVAGELQYDLTDGKWYITNRSGRYGISREEQHLQSVLEEFAKLDLQVEYLFISPV